MVIPMLCLCPVTRMMYEKVLNPLHVDVNFLMVDSIMYNKIEEPTNSIGNFICLWSKQYVYRKICSNEPIKPSELEKELYSLQQRQMYDAKLNNKLSKHINYWSTLYPELSEIDVNNETNIIRIAPTT